MLTFLDHKGHNKKKLTCANNPACEWKAFCTPTRRSCRFSLLSPLCCIACFSAGSPGHCSRRAGEARLHVYCLVPVPFGSYQYSIDTGGGGNIFSGKKGKIQSIGYHHFPVIKFSFCFHLLYLTSWGKYPESTHDVCFSESRYLPPCLSNFHIGSGEAAYAKIL